MAYTVNIRDHDGSAVAEAENDGLHAYHSEETNVTAIETEEKHIMGARNVASKYGDVIHAYE